jgi:hypothetical protein
MTQEPPQAAAVVTAFPTRKRYEAFVETGLEVPRLALCVGDRLLSVPYGAIGPITFGPDTNALFFSIDERHEVAIRGTNLRPVFWALHRQGCASIQEFDTKLFLPPDPAATRSPFVERIDVDVMSGRAPEGEKAQK